MEYGYLRRNQENKHYLLGTRFLYFSDRAQAQFDLIPIARPHLEQLSANTEASANLCILDSQMAVYIDHVCNYKQVLRTFTHLGAREPLYATGVGKIFLSQMTADELNGYFPQTKMERFTGYTIRNPKILMAEIERVRNQGYAIDNQERAIGVRCISAPILNRNSLVIAAISISGAAQFIPMDRIESLSKIVMNTAANISLELGYKQYEHNYNGKLS